MATLDQVDIDIILADVKVALSEGNWQGAVSLIDDLRPPDQASLFGDLSPSAQDALLPRLNPHDSADILEELEEEEAAMVANRMDPSSLIQILEHMEHDEAADLLGDISPEQASGALAKMAEAEEIRSLLIHDDETAGGVMTSVEVKLHTEMTAREAIAYLRKISPDTESIYYLFIVDEDDHLVGVVSLRELVIASPSSRIGEIMDQDVVYVLADADQEDAARLVSRYDLLALPVVNQEMRLLGIITHDDTVEVIEEEATEDIYRLGGVFEGQPLDVPIPIAMRNRLPWLVLNLGTAMASALVLSFFEDTIAQVAVLAAFFPMVAGVSGSAGTQTLTVTVRGLALGEISPRHGISTLIRELLIGIINGIAVGIIVGVIAYAWKGTPVLGIVVGVATLANMICAGIAGVLVPLGIQSLKLDPALASPILVTTTTDTFGYLIYLGLATILLMRLL
jgi:magnesium transporter